VRVRTPSLASVEATEREEVAEDDAHLSVQMRSRSQGHENLTSVGVGTCREEPVVSLEYRSLENVYRHTLVGHHKQTEGGKKDERSAQVER